MPSLDQHTNIQGMRTLVISVLMASCFCSCRQGFSVDEGASGKAFLEAVKMGNNPKAALLLTEGVYTEIRDEKGDSPLLYAVRTGNIPLVRMMLGHGVLKDARSGNGRGALELALDSGNKEMMLCLLEGGVSVDEVCHDNNPIFLKAVRFGDMETVKLLLKSGVSAHTAGKDGQTALHIAARDGLKQCMDLMLASGVNPDVKNDEGLTPLWAAAGASGPVDRWEGIYRLLEAGADCDSPDMDGETLLTLAIRGGLYDEAVELINHGAEVNGAHDGAPLPIEVAVESNRKEMLELLLSRGADGFGLLDDAFKRGDAGLVRSLLAAGVCLRNDTREDGLIAGFVRKGQVELVALCLQYGAHPYLPGKEGENPLHMAIAAGNAPMVNLLLQYGGLSETDGIKDDLIARCVRKGGVDLVKLCLEYGADPLELGQEGQTPLHMAIAMRNTPMVKLLLQHGADPNAYFLRPVSKAFLELAKQESMNWFLKSERRVTPLMMAANNGDVEIISSLIDHGARKYVHTARHKIYPLNFASRKGNVAAMQVILGQDPDDEACHAVLDLSEQKMRLYNDENEVIFSSRVSTGKAGYRTPEGSYVITDKHVRHRSTIYGAKMPYFQRLSCSAFGFHSGNCPGYPASHGCIRMPYSAAKKFFGLTPVGTRVEIQP